MDRSQQTGAPTASGIGATEAAVDEARQDDAAVNIPAVHDAKRTCEAAILAAINAFERRTGLQVSRIDLDGQTTVGGAHLTALVGVTAVLR